MKRAGQAPELAQRQEPGAELAGTHERLQLPGPGYSAYMQDAETLRCRYLVLVPGVLVRVFVRQLAAGEAQLAASRPRQPKQVLTPESKPPQPPWPDAPIVVVVTRYLTTSLLQGHGGLGGQQAW